MSERNPNWPACWREASATYDEAKDEIRVVVVVDASALGEDGKEHGARIANLAYQAAIEAAYARGVAHGRAAAKKEGGTWG